MMVVAKELSQTVGKVEACTALSVPRASFYRWLDPVSREQRPRPSPPRALMPEERERVLETLNSEEFMDKAPAEVFAELLERDEYLCSIRTMYRILEENKEVRERRDVLRHPSYSKPELLATGPNQVWSWDITKLLGPEKWTYYYLYVILDIFSRHVVGWMLAHKESSALAQKLIAETVIKEGIEEGQLILHADRGSSMSSKPVAFLLADLGVTKSHSRPHVSDDNPFSEAQFKTIKYRPEFPDRFGSIEDGRAFCRPFFNWYNTQHHHSGIALLTPAAVHHGQAETIIRKRQEVLSAAYAAHPERFVRGRPTAGQLPREVWINPPTQETGGNTKNESSARRSDARGSSLRDDLESTRPEAPPEPNASQRENDEEKGGETDRTPEARFSSRGKRTLVKKNRHELRRTVEALH